MTRGIREKPSPVCRSVTYALKFRRTGMKMFVTLAGYEDGRLGAIFVDMAKEGSTLRASVSAWAIACSKAIQYGMPVRELVESFRGVRNQPAGVLACADAPRIDGWEATSIWDAIARLVEVETDDAGRLLDLLA